MCQCLRAFPFGNAIAAVLCIVGSLSMGGGFFAGIHITYWTIWDLFGFEVQWLTIVKILGIVVSLVAAAFAILLFIFGFHVKKATRQKIYRGTSGFFAGRISASFFLIVSYVLHIGWLALSCVLLLPVLYWLMFESVCDHELFLPYRLAQAHSPDAALNFTRAFRYFFNITRYGIYRNTSLLGGTDSITSYKNFTIFCGEVQVAGPLFALAWAGAFLVAISLVLFIALTMSQSERIKYVKELSECREAQAALHAYAVGADGAPVTTWNAAGGGVGTASAVSGVSKGASYGRSYAGDEQFSQASRLAASGKPI